MLPNGTLKIANATRQDAGSYTCIAKNQFGTASTAGKLLITGESGTQTLLHYRASFEKHMRSFSSASDHTCSERVSSSDLFRNVAKSVTLCSPKEANTLSLWKCGTILASALTQRVLDRFVSTVEGSLFCSHHPL